MTEDDLKKRTKQFALRILKLVAALPRTIAGRTIGGQLAVWNLGCSQLSSGLPSALKS